MRKSIESNFAARLLARLGKRSHLTSAPSGHTLRAKEIIASITACAAAFQSAGMAPGDRVLISCGLNPATVIAYLGAMYGGLVAVPVEDRQLATLGELLFAKSGAKAIWVGKRIRCNWAKQHKAILLEGDFDGKPACTVRPAPCSYDDLAALMPTSGSTGVPRLVRVSHGNLIANTEAIVRSQSLAPDDSAMLILPVSYCFGASVMQTHLYQGGGVALDPRFMFPDKVLRAINTFGCTTMAGVPAVYNILLRRSNFKSIGVPSLRRFLQAGGALAPERIQEVSDTAPAAGFYVMYGQTEATARIACLPPDKLKSKLGSVGLPLDNLRVSIVDDEGQELSIGRTGEIQVQGPSVCSGYFDDPEATQRKFGCGWVKTGDLGCVDGEGYLWLKGRKGEFAKIRGLRVGFAEVEQAIAAIPGVDECAATAVEHPEAGEALALFIVEDGKSNGTVERVRRALPPYWTCSSVNLVTELPKTVNGKIARSKLQVMS